MIEEVRIDSDEDGFTVDLIGDFEQEFRSYESEASATLRLRLSPEAAEQLLGQAAHVLGPYIQEMRAQKLAYDRATPEERTRVIGGYPMRVDSVW